MTFPSEQSSSERARRPAEDEGVRRHSIPRRASAGDPPPTDEEVRVICKALAFDFDLNDPEETHRTLGHQGRRAAAAGRAADFMMLSRMDKAAEEWRRRAQRRGRDLDDDPWTDPEPDGDPDPGPETETETGVKGEGDVESDDDGESDVEGSGSSPAESPPAPVTPKISLSTPARRAVPLLRPAQTPPVGNWPTWLFLGGRGAGKTLAGATWLADQGMALRNGRVALVGPTLHDVREVMIEGVSGVRSLARWDRLTRPRYEASRRRLLFHGGCVAHVFSAEDPDSLRGPQFSAAWADEFCAWPGSGARGAAETLALLRMGLRLNGPEGAPPRLVVTTTPRPTRALVRLREEAGCVLTHAGTLDNAAHLSPGFVERLRELYGGTKRAAQELEGLVVDLDGALFPAALMARARTGVGFNALAGPTGFDRIVVAVDPTTTAGGDACGIVCAGVRRRPDGVREAVVLADRTTQGVGPDAWARRAVETAREYGAHAIVAEVNQGGDMVRAVLKTAGCVLPIHEVRATRGKRIRAEPVAALYEQDRIRHAGTFDALEEELMALGGELEGAFSLDRADALVWAVTDLLIDRASGEWGPSIRRL